MQILVQALCTKGKSLREAIGSDARLAQHRLQVTRQMQAGRAPGWMKLHATDTRRGALNIEWDTQSAVLSARVITRGSRKPSPIVGDFINYLLSRHGSRVQTVTVAFR
ncbi:MAG: hypothetical protein ACHQRK_05275 [Gemmatimonadales bacterium]